MAGKLHSDANIPCMDWARNSAWHFGLGANRTRKSGTDDVGNGVLPWECMVLVHAGRVTSQITLQ
jgi:hypothetical protein